MSTHKRIDAICVIAVILTLALTALFMSGEAFGVQPADQMIGYENRLFDTSRIHTIDIVIDDWDGFIETCQSEEYSVCNVIIDGENCKGAGIRGKGNSSLSSVARMDSSRYSFKIEFDQYDSAGSYHGLDKLCLNNLIQDNTMMKDYLCYQMMNAFGVASPLCSFAYITVNGEDWGLYLAAEGIEDAFLQRNYGNHYGELYKPDSMSLGGGRGNGQNFDMNNFADLTDLSADLSDEENENTPPQPGQDFPAGNFDRFAMRGGGGGFNFGGAFGGASDVKLQYIDDEPDSYSNIFNNAKTPVSSADQARLIASLQSLSNYEDLDNVLDIDAVLRYFVVHNFAVNGDSYTGNMIHNYYLYEKDGRLAMIPWDYNLAFGSFGGGSATSAVNDAVDDVLSDRPMQAWIFSDESYTRQYHELYTEFLNTVDTAQMIDDAYALIADYVEKDPTKFCSYEEFENGVQALKDFCALRWESARGQLAGIIPAASEQQNVNQNALVNADAVRLSDMGSSGMGGGNRGGFRGEMEIPESVELPDSTESLDGAVPPNGMNWPDGQGMADAGQGRGDGTRFQQQRGEMNPAGNTPSSAVSTETLVLLGISAAALVIGLFVAIRIKH